MAQFVNYRDGDEEKGPFNEATVLNLNNSAEFTSHVAFQIRSSENDSAASFVQLSKLSLIVSVKRRRSERLPMPIVSRVFPRKAVPTKPTAKKKKDTRKSAKNKANLIPNFPGATLIACAKSMLVLANMKQFFIHSILGCHCVSYDVLDTFSPDFARWKAEDEARLSMGRRLFSQLTSEEKGSLRHHIDFIEDINSKLEKEIELGNEDGIEKAREFLISDAAKKLKDRLEKHCREQRELVTKLVCNQCEVACKNHIHFIIHISTLGHRMKVKGTNFELIALFLGWINRDIYLNVADESELEESIEADMAQLSMMDAWRMMGFPPQRLIFLTSSSCYPPLSLAHCYSPSPVV